MQLFHKLELRKNIILNIRRFMFSGGNTIHKNEYFSEVDTNAHKNRRIHRKLTHEIELCTKDAHILGGVMIWSNPCCNILRYDIQCRSNEQTTKYTTH